MTIELALTQALPKPWGVVDLRPWNRTGNTDVAIGEIWYDRPGEPSLRPSLLLKLLFTSEPLSIQVPSQRCVCALDGTADTVNRRRGTSLVRRPVPG